MIGAFGQGGGTAGAPAGNLQSVLETLAANGLAEHVSSWIGNGQNLPVSAEQISSALGSEQVQQMAAATGLPIGDFLKHLAAHLPTAAAEAAGSATS